MAKKFYVVWKGRKLGIHKTWDECKKAIDGYKGAIYKSFKTWDEALEAYRDKSCLEGASKSSATSTTKTKGIKTYTSKDILELSETVKLFTDGGCEPNPGEAGSGIALYRNGEIESLWYGIYNPMGTNNTAELNALHEALLIAEKELAKGETVAVFSDSQYSIQCITQWAVGWEAKGWKKKGGEIKNLEIIQKIYSLYQNLKSNIQLLHVNGHVGVEGNELADRMTTYAIDKKCEAFVQYEEEINIDKVLSMRAG